MANLALWLWLCGRVHIVINIGEFYEKSPIANTISAPINCLVWYVIHYIQTIIIFQLNNIKIFWPTKQSNFKMFIYQLFCELFMKIKATIQLVNLTDIIKLITQDTTNSQNLLISSPQIFPAIHEY